MIHVMAGVVDVVDKVCRAQHRINTMNGAHRVVTVDYSYGMTGGKLWMGSVVVHWTHGPEKLYISERLVCLSYKRLVERITDFVTSCAPYGLEWDGARARYRFVDSPYKNNDVLMEVFVELRHRMHRWRVTQDIDVDETVRKVDDEDEQEVKG